MKTRKSHTESTHKRPKAPRPTVAAVTANIEELSVSMRKDFDEHQSKIRALEERMGQVDNAVLSVDNNLERCYGAVCAVKDALEVHTEQLSGSLTEAAKEYEGRFSAVDARSEALTGSLRLMEEQHAAHFDSVRRRIDPFEERIPQIEAKIASLEEHMPHQDAGIASLEEHIPHLETGIASLEARIPQIETEIKTLDAKLGAITQMQEKINARIVSVMKMSLAMIGVMVVALGILGWILFRH